MQTPFNVFWSLLKICWFFILGHLLPNKGKRILFLTSVYTRLVEKGLLHEDTLNRLNRILVLADNDLALTLPPSIYQRVIDEEQLREAIKGIESSQEGDLCLTYNEARKVSQRIVSLSPDWLKYDDKKTMENDIVSLFYCHTA